MELCSKCADKSCTGYDSRITECEDFRPETNADKIRSMTDEELADFMTDDFCELLCKLPTVCDGQCNLKLLQWLKKEAE